MANQDWSNFEEGIKDFGDNLTNMIQSAIDSQDFKKLNETTKRTIKDAMENVNRSVNAANQKINQKTTSYQKTPYKKVEKQKSWIMTTPQEQNDVYASGKRQLYKNPTGMTAGGIVLAALGWFFTGGIGISILVLILVGMNLGFEAGMGVAVGVLIPFMIGSVFMAGVGVKRLGMIRRFKAYVRELRGREYCPISDLANVVGKPETFVVKDVRAMLDKNMFKQGHLDRQQSCLMITDEAYQQYHIVQQQLEARQAMAITQQETQAENDSKQKYSDEVEKVIDEGNAYIKQIQASNAAIEDEMMSMKISRMELITQKIFSRVAQQPSLVSDLHKFMGYYLPMTIKLLNAYQELDAQPVQGDNITSSKQEIEETLDTINQAFENLLDSFFQDKAWDISSDISVLQAMLAQEGLTNSDFMKEKENEHESGN